MEHKKEQIKTPISHERIYRITLIVTIVVSSIFLFKNIISKSVQGVIVIGVCMAVFGGILLVMHLKNVDTRRREFVLSIGLLFLVFIISLNSGAYYSDDFPLFLTIVGMTGLYLEPKFTYLQIVIADILLVIMYIIHPEKAESLSQYIMCLVIFTLAAVLFGQTIKRGGVFIEISKMRAKEAEKLLDSMQNMGKELEEDFAQSSYRIENNTQELREGSFSIAQSAVDMTDSCNDVQERIHMSEQSLVELNTEVNVFEQALMENCANMESMKKQLAAVSNTILGANEVFQTMEQKMNEITKIAEQLNAISFNTSILSLNASVEATRAGDAGAGFGVVASEMRKLSNNSNMFSEQVSEVVSELLSQVGETAAQFMDSTNALKESEVMMNQLEESFGKLNKQFSSLYGNIEIQNRNVTEVNVIFNDLKEKVMEMQKSSMDNQGAVEAIVDAMELYKVNINHVIENTRKTDV